MRGWKSLTLGEIAAYMDDDPSFTLKLRTSRPGARADGFKELIAAIEFQGDGSSRGPLPAVASVLLSIIERERP